MLRIQRSLAREHTMDGHWWICDYDDKKLAGRLTYTPSEGLSLQLFGDVDAGPTLLGDFQSFVSNPYKRLVLHGRAQIGIRVTLFDCFRTSSVENCVRFSASHALIGTHFFPHSPKLVRDVSLRTSNFEAWCDAFRVNTTEPQWHLGERLIDTNDAGNAWHVTATPAMFRQVAGQLPAIPGSLEIWNTVNKTGDSNRITLEGESELRIYFDSPIEVGMAATVASRAIQLLSLLIGHPVTRTYQCYSFNDDSSAAVLERSIATVKAFPIPTAVMPCPLKTSNFDFPEVLNGWLLSAARLSSAMNLLHAVLMRPDAFLESRVSQIMQGLEAFCAETIKFTYLPEMEFEAITQKLLGVLVATDADFRQRAKSTISYLNELSLRSFLKRLLAAADSEIREGLLGTHQQNDFIELAVQLRNAIVHPQSGVLWDKFEVRQVVDMMPRLGLLLIVSMLANAGMPLEILRTRFNNPACWNFG